MGTGWAGIPLRSSGAISNSLAALLLECKASCAFVGLPDRLQIGEERLQHFEQTLLLIAADTVAGSFNVHYFSFFEQTCSLFIFLPEITLGICLQDQRRDRDLRE